MEKRSSPPSIIFFVLRNLCFVVVVFPFFDFPRPPPIFLVISIFKKMRFFIVAKERYLAGLFYVRPVLTGVGCALGTMKGIKTGFERHDPISFPFYVFGGATFGFTVGRLMAPFYPIYMSVGTYLFLRDAY